MREKKQKTLNKHQLSTNSGSLFSFECHLERGKGYSCLGEDRERLLKDFLPKTTTNSTNSLFH